MNVSSLRKQGTNETHICKYTNAYTHVCVCTCVCVHMCTQIE